MREKPIHVLVAEALGEKPLPAEWGFTAPPSEGFWSHERSRLMPTVEEAKAAWAERPEMDHAATVQDWHECYWKDGWGPILVPRYHEEWFETGPIIERVGCCLLRRKTGDGWAAEVHQDRVVTSGWHDTPLLAVCGLVLVLHAAGRLEKACA